MKIKRFLATTLVLTFLLLQVPFGFLAETVSASQEETKVIILEEFPSSDSGYIAYRYVDF